MKAIIKQGPGAGAAYTDVPIPELADNEVRFTVESAAICGTDVHLYNWDETAISFVDKYHVGFPFTLGHEVSGVIVEVGKNVRDKKVGERISLETHIPCWNCYPCKTGNAHACANMGLYGITYNGAFAEYGKAPADIVFSLPDTVSFEEGSMFEPAAVAMHAVENVRIMPGDTVLVYGCGPIGLVTIQLALACGASRVIAIDVNPFRLDMARKYVGVTAINGNDPHLVEQVRDLTIQHGGVDVAFEVTGAAPVYETIFDLIRDCGTLAIIGHPAGSVPINITRNINQKCLTIKGTFGRRIWQSWLDLAAMVGSKRVDLTKIVTHRYTFDQFEEAFAMTHGDAGKILFKK